jgi:hypothetical protein
VDERTADPAFVRLMGQLGHIKLIPLRPVGLMRGFFEA